MTVSFAKFLSCWCHFFLKGTSNYSCCFIFKSGTCIWHVWYLGYSTNNLDEFWPILYAHIMLTSKESSNYILSHLYANDAQIYGACSPSTTVQFQNRIWACVDDIAIWMQSNRLQLNSAKTEVLWCSSNRRQHQIRSLVSGLARMAFVILQYTLMQMFSYRHMLRRQSRVASLFYVIFVVYVVLFQNWSWSHSSSRLDYGNATLARLDQSLIRLQSVLNAAARLIYMSCKFNHVTPLLRKPHWLCFPEKIDFKLALLVFKCLYGLAPLYLALMEEYFIHAQPRLGNARPPMVAQPWDDEIRCQRGAQPRVSVRCINEVWALPEYQSWHNLDEYRLRRKRTVKEMGF